MDNFLISLTKIHLKLTYKNDLGHDNPYGKIIYLRPCRSTMTLNKKNVNNQIRYMWRGTSHAVAKTATKVSIPVTQNVVPTQGYRYDVTNVTSETDNSKHGHPSVAKTTCDTENCDKTNCAQNVSQCDINSQQSHLVGHRGHNVNKVDSELKKINLPEDNTPRGEVITVIYNKGEAIAENTLYDYYRYHDSKFVQKDENSAKLQEATKHITKSTNENQ